MDLHLVIPLLPGDVVGRYRVEDFVAEGGMGQVFRAWDTMLERRVALKVVRADHAGDTETMLRFQREAQILARLDHAGICRVYDWLDWNGTWIMAMEWVEGESLSALLEKGALPAEQATRLLWDVATAMAAAHARGVIHRDLKPSNILIRPNGRAKVLDFGLAKACGPLSSEGITGQWDALAGEDEATALVPPERSSPLTLPGTVMGTRGYIAPELLRGAPASPATDLYALGVIAHLMLTGEPYQGQKEKPLSWPQRVLQPPKAPAKVRSGSHVLWSLVDRLLAPDPRARPQASEVVDALGRMLSPPSRIRWVALTAGLALVAGAGGLWLYGRGAIPEFSAARPARVVVVPVRNLTQSNELDATVGISTTELLEDTLRGLVQVRVVSDRALDRDGSEVRPQLPSTDPQAEFEFLQRVVARTGADLVVLAEVSRSEGPDGFRLNLRLFDRTGRIRALRDLQTRSLEFVPSLLVPQAVQLLHRSLSPLRQAPIPLPPPSREAVEAYGRGKALLEREQHQQALPWLEQAAFLAPQHAPSVISYGAALFLMRDARAVPTLMWARAAAREAGDRFWEARALRSLAMITQRSGRAERLSEEALYREALSLAKASGDEDLQADLLLQLGIYRNGRSEYEAAGMLLRSALKLASTKENNEAVASILVELANSAKGLEQLAEARTLYREAAVAAAKAGDQRLEEIPRNNLAVLDLGEGLTETAEREFQHVLRIRREFGDLDGECRVLLNLGIVDFMQGSFDKAEAHFKGSLALAQKIDLGQMVGRASYRLGDVHRAQGNLDLAARELEEAASQMRRKGSPVNRTETLAALAECRARLGRVDEAERLLDEARKLGSGDMPQVWRAQAWIHRQRGRLQAATDSLARALHDPGRKDPDHQTEIRTRLAEWQRRP